MVSIFIGLELQYCSHSCTFLGLIHYSTFPRMPLPTTASSKYQCYISLLTFPRTNLTSLRYALLFQIFPHIFFWPMDTDTNIECPANNTTVLLPNTDTAGSFFSRMDPDHSPALPPESRYGFFPGRGDREPSRCALFLRPRDSSPLPPSA